MALALSNQPPEVRTYMPSFCRRCYVERVEVPGYPGVYRCPTNPEHDQDEGQAAPLEPMPPGNPLIDRAVPLIPRPQLGYWLARIGLTVPLPSIPQSNAGDGTYCQGLGEIAPGGSGTGRARKKGDKGGKKFTDSPWDSEGGTNQK